jgi:hypothetical protein
MPLDTSAVHHLRESILYLSSLLRPASRHIDQYIDYFGGIALRPAPQQVTRAARRRPRAPRVARS